MAALTYAEREELDTGLGYFFAGLLSQVHDTKNNPAAKALVQLGRGAGNPDANAFLKQAAVLHSDVAAYGDQFPLAASDIPDAPPTRTEELRIGGGMGSTTLHTSEPVAPLLTANRIVLGQDGEIVGQVVASWNWPFARFLLDLVDKSGVKGNSRKRPDAVTDPFVPAWYHATAAYMFANGSYGDLTPHVHRAMELFADDARIVFDRACYAELWGLPMHQALTSERDVIERRRPVAAGTPTWTPPVPAPVLAVPAAEKTNAEAERLFRRAIELDPAHVEARVRLARLLLVLKRGAEAAAELKIALAGNPDGVLAFYARLFAGRAAQSLGNMDEAASHFDAARALFPAAQSALLASSQLALLRSDVPGALTPIGRLGDSTAAFSADPWWQYQLCSGRDAEPVLRSLWASVPRGIYQK
jgi:hypothetical protein